MQTTYKQLNNSYEAFIDLDNIGDYDELLKEEDDLNEAYDIAFKALKRLSGIEGTVMYNIIQRTIKQTGNSSKIDLENVGGYILLDSDVRSFVHMNKNLVIDALTSEVGKIIFGSLTTGTIDLADADAVDGDKLKIFVQLFVSAETNVDEDSDTGEPISYQVGSFQVRETGWSPKIVDSFFLIQRMGTNPDGGDQNMFGLKSAAGVTAMYGYSYDGITRNPFLKKLQPSIGLNVSYIDFDPDKDFEIGCGIVGGLFKNLVHFGVGMNLNMMKDDNPYYFAIGFSFSNIAGKLME